MKIRILLCILILLKVLSAQANRRDTIRLFYNINQSKLSPQQKTELDSIANTLSDTASIRIYGYADYLGDRKANYTLSNARGEEVKEYLLKRNRNLQLLAVGQGQVDAVTTILSPLGEPFNRRTDIVVNKQAPLLQLVLKNVPPDEVYPKTVHPATAPLKPIPEDRMGRLLSLQPPAIKKNDSVVYKRITDLPKLNVGDSVNFEEFTFQPGRHLLRQAAIPYMVALKECLKNNPTLKIEIQGHICCQYDGRDGVDLDMHTKNLSVTRAKFIYDYLVSEGISVNRLSYKGLGSKEPKVYPELSADDQNQNRRVVIVLTGK